MKTVMDAVNKYMGRYPEMDWEEDDNKKHCLVECIKSPYDCEDVPGNLAAGGSMFDREYYRLICTKHEFNQCVAELSAWQPSTPTETPDEKLALDAIGQKSPYDVGAHVSDASKPVFTKEMADAGGYEFYPSKDGSSNASWFKFDVVAISRGVAFGFDYSNPVCGGRAASFELCNYDFRKIKTEREKLIDKAALLIASKDVLHNQYPEALTVAGMLYDAGLLTNPPKQG